MMNTRYQADGNVSVAVYGYIAMPLRNTSIRYFISKYLQYVHDEIYGQYSFVKNELERGAGKLVQRDTCLNVLTSDFLLHI